MMRVCIVLLGLLVGLGMTLAQGGTELSVMMGLGEMEWRVMREQVFPPFERQHGVTIRGIQAEAADAVKKLVAMHCIAQSAWRSTLSPRIFYSWRLW
jgi:hypothetical protein